MKFKSLFIIVFLFFNIIPMAAATMVLSNSIVHFGPDQPTREDIQIENPTSEPLYVKVSPFIVHNPGTQNESRELISNPKTAGLLVSPNKLVIPPGGRKLVRFVNLNPASAKEYVYRVAITPVVGEVKAETTGVKILVGYEVLVLTQPVNPQPDLQVARVGNALQIKNAGNTNVLLREGYQCPSDDAPKEECTALRGKRVYPGNDWSVELTSDRPIEYYLAVGRKNSVAVYP